MIFKSYIIEKDQKLISKLNSILFYGVNIGLKRDFKNIIKDIYKKSLILNFVADEIAANPNILTEQINKRWNRTIQTTFSSSSRLPMEACPPNSHLLSSRLASPHPITTATRAKQAAAPTDKQPRARHPQELSPSPPRSTCPI